MTSSGWLQLREGMQRKPLAADGERNIQMDLIKIKPNLVDRPHVHDDFEWVYVLEGSFTDARGVHKKGDFIVNTTEGIHQVSTGDDGCLLLILWSGSVSEVG
jgi:anti-sigma factor ChrR (cupin superfamily)